MRTKASFTAQALTFSLLASYACGLFGGGVGVCVSDPVSFSFGLRVYCYSNYNESECSDYDSQQVNGAANWTFHSGQTCSDRDLTEGSNPWP
jgi:hypothetical protein